MKWFSKDDELQFNLSEPNFQSKLRGKKPINSLPGIPLNLTRRQCVSKVAEIFDLTGLLTPVTASMKLDLHELIIRKLQWDDPIPNELRKVWTSHFEMMQEMGNFRFQRAVVPKNAVSLEINTIDTADASMHMACAAIYARFKLDDGHFSCQLVFARSKLIPEGTSQPRCELLAAHLNAHTGEVVRRSFGAFHLAQYKLSDSQIVLHWLNNN